MILHTEFAINSLLLVTQQLPNKYLQKFSP